MKPDSKAIREEIMTDKPEQMPELLPADWKYGMAFRYTGKMHKADLGGSIHYFVGFDPTINASAPIFVRKPCEGISMLHWLGYCHDYVRAPEHDRPSTDIPDEAQTKKLLDALTPLYRAAYGEMMPITGIDIAHKDLRSFILSSRPVLTRQPVEGEASLQKSVEETVKESGGFWHPCTGCYETVDGQDNGHYAYSKIFKCTLGIGCHGCGGIGAVWDNTDYEAWAKDIQQCAINAAKGKDE